MFLRTAKHVSYNILNEDVLHQGWKRAAKRMLIDFDFVAFAVDWIFDVVVVFVCRTYSLRGLYEALAVNSSFHLVYLSISTIRKRNHT